MSESLVAPSVFLARQPIYDRHLKVHAYELLYRRDSTSGAGIVGPQESASTIIRAIVEIGLDKLVGNKPAFINIPSYLLTDQSLYLLPKDRVVLEILEDTEPTDEALYAASELTAAGYKIALDDFVFGSPLVEFLEFAKIVKVDLKLNTKPMLSACVDLLKKSRVRMLGEKVETMEVFAQCRALGFQYFQGYFCAKPEIVMGRGVPPMRTNLLNLLNRIQDPAVTIEELEAMIANDVSLTYRLLRLVNSVASSARDQVDSVRTALIVLGLDRVGSLISLLALSGINDKPHELLVTAMVRAKMCEGIARESGLTSPDKHFTVGLLSVLDALFDMTMEEILSQIPLAPDLKDALGNPSSLSPLSESLRIAKAYESGQWESLKDLYANPTQTAKCYVEAVKWADETQVCLAA